MKLKQKRIYFWIESNMENYIIKTGDGKIFNFSIISFSNYNSYTICKIQVITERRSILVVGYPRCSGNILVSFSKGIFFQLICEIEITNYHSNERIGEIISFHCLHQRKNPCINQKEQKLLLLEKSTLGKKKKCKDIVRS